MNKVIILIILSLTTYYLHAANNTTNNNKQIEIEQSKDGKLFIRGYTYRASEDDSKNSSRKKAIEQLKILLSEEIGTHIENYLEIKKQNRNNVSYQSVKNEISSLSASITKLNILDEKWDGKSYYVKASVRVNEKRTLELILQEIKSKSSEKDVKRLNAILKEQEILLTQQSTTIQGMNKKLVSQEIINKAKKNEITSMKKDLIKYQKEEIEKNKEAMIYKSKLDEKKALIRKLNTQAIISDNKETAVWEDTKSLLCRFEKGTNKYAIEKIIGHTFTQNKDSSTKGQYTDYICPSTYIKERYGYECMYFSFIQFSLISRYGCSYKLRKKYFTK